MYPVAQHHDVSLLETVQTQTATFLAQLIQMKPEAVNEKGWGGLTPLHKACMRGDVSIIELLLASGAEPDTPNDGGETPLHYGSRRGNPVALDCLVRAGADPKRVDNKGRTALHHAAMNGSVYSLLWLEEVSGLPMDVCDSSGRSPLYYACFHGQRDAVRLLLNKQRCPVNLLDDEGNSCLHAALESGYDHIMYLIATQPAGYKLLTTENKAGHTVYSLVEKEGKKDTLKYEACKNFLRMMMLLPNLQSVRFVNMFLRLMTAFTPLVTMLVAVVSHFLLPRFKGWIFILCSMYCLWNTRTQSHRMFDSSQAANPAQAGAFFAGIFHSLLCFYVELVPSVTGLPDWVLKLSYIAGIFQLLVYVTLLIRDPGYVTQNDIKVNPVTKLPLTLAQHIRQCREGACESFCTVCEISYAHRRVKHCKLCDKCVVDLDHHCLFLMKCVAKNNLRLFLFLVLSTLLSISVFLGVTFFMFKQVCGFEKNPIMLVYCMWRVSPWVFITACFDGASFIWGSCMVRYQLSVISEGNTSYYRSPFGIARVKVSVRVLNILYYVCCGRLYKKAECDRVNPV